MIREVQAVFDIGKTNKKFLLYDSDFNCVHKTTVRLPESIDEDLFPCEDYILLKDWVLSSFVELLHDKRYRIKSLNFSAYGATLVNLDENNQPTTPIYNYLKSYPQILSDNLYNEYGGINQLCEETASPALGHLNSGLTLLWIKEKQPDVYKKIKTSLHLPEFLSFLFTDDLHSNITSIGCHTHLWDYSKNKYHDWVIANGIHSKLAPLYESSRAVLKYYNYQKISIGMGLHDSSASLVPHLKNEKEPFILLSTGTWSIALNPFNDEPLTNAELQADCLCYMSYSGKPVKAARYYAGGIHEDMIEGLCKVYDKKNTFFYHLSFDEGLYLMASEAVILEDSILYYNLPNAALAYHQFIYSLVTKILPSIKLVAGKSNPQKIIIEGGFSKNVIFVEVLKRLLPNYKVFTTNYEEASALGAALVMESSLINTE